MTEMRENDFFGPVGKWIFAGMKRNPALKALGLDDYLEDETLIPTKEEEMSVHTIVLPARAPKQLLLDLKQIFQTFPGKDKIQLKIGEQLIPVPITVTLSTILDAKIADVMQKYEETAAV
jgi:hypothetical protein